MSQVLKFSPAVVSLGCLKKANKQINKNPNNASRCLMETSGYPWKIPWPTNRAGGELSNRRALDRKKKFSVEKNLGFHGNILVFQNDKN